MKFSDIDFSAISRMMDNMSDEEKNKSDQYSGKTGYVQSTAAADGR